MNIFDQTIGQLEHGINYSSTKNKLNAQNIANVDTPNYKTKDIQFKTLLEGKLAAKKTHPKHKSFENDQANYRVTTKTGTIYNHNNNNVDIDKEMAELAKNQLHYQSLVERINGKFYDLQTVIRGGS